MRRKIKLILMLWSIGIVFLSSSCFAQNSRDYFPHQQGCFLLFNLTTNKLEKQIGDEYCQVQWVASSTFKIPLALMAFDTGVLKDEDQVLKWDGHVEDRAEVNHDHNARTWIRDSVVWFSKRLTPQIGPRRIQQYLKSFNYGNQDMNGGLTQSWLIPPSQVGPALKISAYDQLEFMKNLWNNKLHVSERAMQITRQLIYLETSSNGVILSGKTGSNFFKDGTNRRLGWFISHLSKGNTQYISVTNFVDLLPPLDKAYGGVKAKEITKEILKEMGLW